MYQSSCVSQLDQDISEDEIWRHDAGVALTLDFDACSIQRDVAIRGRDVASVIEQYTQQVKPAFDQYVAPSRKHADVIIPWVRYASQLLTFFFSGMLETGAASGSMYAWP